MGHPKRGSEFRIPFAAAAIVASLLAAPAAASAATWSTTAVDPAIDPRIDLPRDTALNPQEGMSHWKFELTPYMWLAGIEGDGTINGQDVDFDYSFDDLVDYVEFAGGLLGTAQYDRYLVWFQYDHVGLEEDEFNVGGNSAKFESTLDIVEVAGGYQIDGWSEGQTFDFLAGVRFTEMDNELTVSGVGSSDETHSLTDPIFVVRPSMPMFPSKVDGLRFNGTLAAGAGGDSDFVYELQPHIQYMCTETFGLRFGYRRLGYYFEEGDDELDLELSGLFFGASFLF